MRIDKAIEILMLSKGCEYEGDSQDLEAAIELAIKAMQAVQHCDRAKCYDLVSSGRPPVQGGP